MMQIPIAPAPNQTVFCQLGGQNCQINIRQRIFGVFADLLVANSPIILATYCRNKTPLVASPYLGFIGDLMFADITGGNNDPVYIGLGTQFALIYLEAADLVALAGKIPFV